MATNRFSIPIAELTKQALTSIEDAARKAALDTFRKVVERSPVGNPELWAENAETVSQRTKYQADAQAYNEANPGKRRKGTSRKTVEKKFPLQTGKGYVGGRFRANWNFSYDVPDGSFTDSTSKARGMQEASKAATMNIGGVAYLSNGLPYAKRLEFDAWSKQAPAGMVRVSAMEFDDHLRKALGK